MNSRLWKYTGLLTGTTHTVIFSTYVSRLLPTVAPILAILILIVAIIICTAELEDCISRGLLIGVMVIGVFIGLWDLVLLHWQYIAYFFGFILLVTGLIASVVWSNKNNEPKQ